MRWMRFMRAAGNRHADCVASLKKSCRSSLIIQRVGPDRVAPSRTNSLTDPSRED